MKRNSLRSLGALLAGVLVVAVLSIATDVALHAVGVYPPWGQAIGDALCLLATAYRVVYGVAGAYVTARLAPARPMRHALALGVVGLVLSIAGAAATWGREAEFGPAWYPLALVALAMPQSWAGGWLRERQLRVGTAGDDRKG